MRLTATAWLLSIALAGCSRESPAPHAFDTARVERRDISVTVEAAGVVEPLTTVEIKSKASGEVLALHAETGDHVEPGALLVQIDKREPRNRVAQAEAGVRAARARRDVARSQTERATKLLESRTLTQSEFEQTVLELANSEAQVVTAQVELENARIALGDTEVRAPAAGTIIEKHIERGQVISSPTRDVGGGTLLLKMADLSTVQVRTLVDETDIGKIRPGMPGRIAVSAFPNQPFTGQVAKIEPQAIEEQNVTMFAVLITLHNQGDLLKPGMNADVEINIAQRDDVLAVPTSALRTDRDLASSAQVLGMSEEKLRDELGERAPQRGASSVAKGAQRDAPPADYEFGGDYWVVALENGQPRGVRVRTGVTNLEFSEVLAGLQESQEIYLLPSSSLVESQGQMRERILRREAGVPGISRPANN